jgi:uncharacterized protein YwgA
MRIDFLSGDKLSLLQYVITKNKDLNHNGLGRTALMKLVYLLQEGSGVPVGYDFRLYSYGPYDSQVLQDLDILRQFGLLQEESVQEENYQWNKYLPANEDPDINEESELLNGNRKTIDDLIKNYGNNNARTLELYATTLFVLRDKRDSNKNNILKTIQEIKPKYSNQEIESAFDKIKSEFDN